MAASIKVTPEWYSRMVNRDVKVSEDIMLRLNDLASRRGLDARLRPSSGGEKGGSGQHSVKEIAPSAQSLAVEDAAADNYHFMLDRFRRPGREPSTKEECEEYIRFYFEEASRDGDPNNFPAIMKRLKKTFPLDEWRAAENE